MNEHDRRAPSAAEELFLDHEVGVGRFLAQLCRDRDLAADVLQETFLAVVQSGLAIEEIEHRRAWLYGVARRKALHALRSWRRMTRAYRRALMPGEGLVEPASIVELRDLLERTLSPSDRSLVLLSALYGFSTGELAEMAELRPDAVRKRLSRARHRLLAAATAQASPASQSFTIKPKETP